MKLETGMNDIEAFGSGKTKKVPTNRAELQKLLDTVAALFQAERTKDLQTWGDQWATDARVTFPLDKNPGERAIEGKEAIVAWTAQKFLDRAHTGIDALIEALDSGNRVIAHSNVSLRFTNGSQIAGPLVMAFTFDADGKVLLMEEYVNEAIFPTNYKELAEPAQA